MLACPILDRKTNLTAKQKTVAPMTPMENGMNMAGMTERLGLSTVPAAWPTGVSQLAQAIDTCQRCDTAVVCTDWLARAPKAIELAPVFCPNAFTFTLAKRTRR
jgi:uncharacterized protein DUF6455